MVPLMNSAFHQWATMALSKARVLLEQAFGKRYIGWTGGGVVT